MADINQDPVNHEHDTRKRSDFLRPPKHSTATYEKSVSYAGLKLYNMLPKEIKDLNLNQFKSRIKKFLVNHPMYNITEFESCDLKLM